MIPVFIGTIFHAAFSGFRNVLKLGILLNGISIFAVPERLTGMTGTPNLCNSSFTLS